MRTSIAVFLLCLPAGAVHAAPLMPPVVDREAAERSFLAAYDSFMENRLWDCLDKLNEAQRLNTYYIDVYFMRSLALRRLGRYPDALSALGAYLEVRQSDYRARIIHSAMAEEWRILQESLKPSEILAQYSFNGLNFNSLFTPLPGHPFNGGMTGIGKVAAAGRYVFAPDALGGNLWVFETGSRPGVMGIAAAEPAAVLPLNHEEFLLLLKSGDVMSIAVDPSARALSDRSVGRVGADVADAAVISATLMAVADRRGGAVRFFTLPALDEVTSWKPESGPKLFEPVAAAAYGPLLAVADRGNGVVYVLDSYTLMIRDSFEIDKPRDLEWGNQGELYVLNEAGELYSRFPAGGAASMVAGGMKEAWSMAWTNRGPLVADVSGRTWWRSAVYPPRTASVGTMALREPWIEGESGEETLFLKGRASSMYTDFVLENIPSSEAVWRDEVRPSSLTAANGAVPGAKFVYSPSPDAPFEDVRQAADYFGIWDDLAAYSRTGAEMPQVIVLDTRVEIPEGKLPLFMSFLHHQGIRLDLWALARPASMALTAVSRSTMGYTYFSDLRTIPDNEGAMWQFSVSLPPRTVTFGYPSDATLSIFAATDAIRFNDWIPIWPAIIKRIEEKEQIEE